MIRTEQLLTTMKVSQTSRITLNLIKRLYGFPTLDETILYIVSFFSENVPKSSIDISNNSLYLRLSNAKMKSKDGGVINKFIDKYIDENAKWVPSKSGKGKGKIINYSEPKKTYTKEDFIVEDGYEVKENIVYEKIQENNKPKPTEEDIEKAIDKALNKRY